MLCHQEMLIMTNQDCKSRVHCGRTGIGLLRLSIIFLTASLLGASLFWRAQASRAEINASGSPQQIEDLAIGTPVQGIVSTANDVRNYRVAVTGSQPLFVQLDKPQGWDAGVAIYKGAISGQPVRRSDAWEDQMLMIEAPEATTYIIQVWSSGFYFNQHRGLPGSYTLTALRNLNALTIGQAQAGQAVRSNDQLWYQVQVAGNDPLFVHLDKPRGWDTGVAIYKGTLNNQPVRRSETWEDQMLMIEAPEAATYYIQVWASAFYFGQYRGLPGSYALTVRRSLDALTIGQGQTGQITQANDFFWYQVTVTGNEPLFLHLDKPRGWDAGVIIYKSTLNSQPVRRSEAWEDQMLMIEAPEPATYYVLVWPSAFYFGQYRGLPGNYTMTLRRSLDALTIGQGRAGQITQANDFFWYQVTVTGSEPLFLHFDKPRGWDAGVIIYKGTLNSQPIRRSEVWEDQMLMVETPEPATYYVLVWPSAFYFGQYRGLPGDYTLTARRNLDALPLGSALDNQQLTWAGDKRWYQVTLNTRGPLVARVSRTTAWNAVLRVKRGSLPTTQPDASDSGGGDLEVALLAAEVGIHYVEVESQHNGAASYSIRADNNLSQARKLLTLDNEFVRARISASRGCVTSLIFKKGSNAELIAPQWDAYLIDLGADPKLGQYLKTGWQAEGFEVQSNYLRLIFKHSSGFANELVLSWAANRIEVRCDVTAPEPVETFSVLRPGGGWESGRDKWAFPATDGVKTGSFTYPASLAPLYPTDNSWGTPSEGWIALWDDQVDEVYGFTFSGGFRAKIGNNAGARQYFLFPAGTSRIAFQIVKPKPAQPFEAARALASGPFLALINTVDKLFAGVGTELNYRLSYRNTGRSGATGAVIEDVLPSSLELVQGSISNNGTYDAAARRITWNIGAVPARASQTVAFKAKIAQGMAEGAKIANPARMWSVEVPIATTASALTTVAAAPSITSISPNKGGNTGTVTIVISGSSLDPNAQVKLTGSGFAEITSTVTTGLPDGARLTTTFDLTGKPPGTLNLVVSNPSGGSAVSRNSFTIESGGEPKLWAEIVGMNQIRVGRAATFTIRYGNAGNIDARYPYLAIGLPWRVSHNVDVSWALPHTSPTPPPVQDALNTTLLDLPPLSAGSADSMTFTITPETAGPIMIRARITMDPTPYFDSLLTLPESIPLELLPSSTSAERKRRAGFQDFPQIDYGLQPYPGYVLLWDRRGTLGYWHIAKSLGGGKIIEMWPDSNGPDLRERTLGPEDLDGYRGALRPPDYSEAHGEEVKRRARALLNKFGQTDNQSTWQDGLCKSEVKDGALITNCIGAFHILNPEFRARGLYLEDQIYDELAKPMRWDNSLSNRAINKFAGFLWGAGSCKKGFDDLAKGIWKDINAVQAIDPNAKAGPAGFDSEGTSINQRKNHVGAGSPLPYMIFFENLANATAAAQEILITDQIDASLDWPTFSLSKMKIGEKEIIAPEGVQNFKTTVDLRPTIPTLVEVDCKFNSSTGRAEWLFRGKDPYTGELADLLPPNKPGVAPRGEGWVSYSVKPKQNLTTGTVIRNKATIDFEVGIPPAPLDTPEVFNTIDADAPASQVMSLVALQNSASFEVRWAGSDVGAGVRDYTIFVSENGGPFAAWLSNATESSGMFSGKPGRRYAFYSIARDLTGNQEAAPNAADAATQVATADLALTMTATPNPVVAGGMLTYAIAVINNGPNVATDVTVTDILPASTTFFSCAAPGGECKGSGNNRAITFGSLASGASATISLFATVNPTTAGGTTIGNTATAGVSIDPSLANNSATAITATLAGFTAGGRVATPAGKAIGDVALNFALVSGSGSLPMRVATDVNGNWSQSGFEAGKTYRVTPGREGYTFTPAFIEVISTTNDLNFAATLNLAVVSSASYLTPIAPDSIASAFGASLATRTQVATTLPLPESLAGTTVKIKDSAGREHTARLFFVATNQVNLWVPADVAPGAAMVTITSEDRSVSAGTVQIERCALSLFSADSSGRGVASAVALRVMADGSQRYEPVARFDATQNKYVTIPIDLGPETDQVILLLFGTGIRFCAPGGVVKFADVSAPAFYAGVAGLVGLDQVNAQIPRSLIGRGEMDVVFMADGKTSSTMRINIK
jgi:uncharacterized protein (TIGR03437 family)